MGRRRVQLPLPARLGVHPVGCWRRLLRHVHILPAGNPGLLRERQAATTHFRFCASRSIRELREPGTGANAFSRLPTHRDLLGSFALVRGSRFDSGRLPRTCMSYMACRRSGVRIPLAPPRSEAGSDLGDRPSPCPYGSNLHMLRGWGAQSVVGVPGIASQDAEPITKVPTRPVRTQAHSAATRVGGQVSGMGW
jgi:hypothetical protein